MAIMTLGAIRISGFSPSGASVRFDNDPDTYKREWPRRQSIEEGLAGAVTKQDAGRFAKDMVIRLDSGPTQWLNKSTVDILDEYAGRKGATFVFTDGEDNQFLVTIESFEADQAKGMPELYTYSMTLHVFGITLLRGSAYTGS